MSRLPADRLCRSFGETPKRSRTGSLFKSSAYGIRPIGYADLLGRLPKGVGQDAFSGARQSRAGRAARHPKGCLVFRSAKLTVSWCPGLPCAGITPLAWHDGLVRMRWIWAEIGHGPMNQVMRHLITGSPVNPRPPAVL
jgi:hypothetical protein